MRVIVFIVIALFAAGVASAADVVLVKDGKPNASIVIGSQPSEAARGAAEELQLFLEKISGAKLPIVPQSNAAFPAKVLVGQSAAQSTATSMGITIPSGLTYLFDEEGYVVAGSKDTLILAGNETAPYLGTYFAVYDYLHALGCRWYMPGEFGEVIPKLSTIKAPQKTRIVKPDMRVRDCWYSGHLVQTPQQQTDFVDWKRRNRLTKPGFWLSGMSPEAIYLQNPTDDSTKRLLPRDKFFDSHPEYYALNADGTRNPDFLCVSNPEGLRAAADTVIQYFQDNPNNYSFAFSPPDSPVLCHCDECKKAMHDGFGGEGYGNVSDPYFILVFEIADMVKKVYPDRWIITMAYYNRCRPPEGVDGKHTNVLIQHAFIQQCSIHSYLDKNCQTRDIFASMLARWGELAAGLVAYDYDPHDWNHSQRPGWRSKGVVDDMRFAYKNGSWGYSDEGMMAWLVTGLNYYVRARAAWDLNENVNALEDDFFKNFFGPAYRPMKSFYTGIEKALEKSKIHYQYVFSIEAPKTVDFVAAVSPKVLQQSAVDLKKAQELAVQEPFKTRVTAFKNYFGRLESEIAAREAMAQGDYKKAVVKAQGMLDAVSQVNNSMLLQDAGPWSGSQSGAEVLNIIKGFAEYTNGIRGTLVGVLGDAKYQKDPNTLGLVHRWYLPDYGTKWRDISLTAPWYAQGVTVAAQLPYTGIFWYRCKLNIGGTAPANARIFVPEMKGHQVWAWVNGSFADYSPKPSGASLNASGLLKSGENIICFRVNGFGGLTLPPFVYQPVESN